MLDQRVDCSVCSDDDDGSCISLSAFRLHLNLSAMHQQWLRRVSPDASLQNAADGDCDAEMSGVDRARGVAENAGAENERQCHCSTPMPSRCAATWTLLEPMADWRAVLLAVQRREVRGGGDAREGLRHLLLSVTSALDANSGRQAPGLS